MKKKIYEIYWDDNLGEAIITKKNSLYDLNTTEYNDLILDCKTYFKNIKFEEYNNDKKRI